MASNSSLNPEYFLLIYWVTVRDSFAAGIRSVHTLQLGRRQCHDSRSTKGLGLALGSTHNYERGSPYCRGPLSVTKPLVFSAGLMQQCNRVTLGYDALIHLNAKTRDHPSHHV